MKLNEKQVVTVKNRFTEYLVICQENGILARPDFIADFQKYISVGKDLDVLLKENFNREECDWIKEKLTLYLSILRENGKLEGFLKNYSADILHSSLLDRLLLGKKPNKDSRCSAGYEWWRCGICGVDWDGCPLVSEEEKILHRFGGLKKQAKDIKASAERLIISIGELHDRVENLQKNRKKQRSRKSIVSRR